MSKPNAQKTIVVGAGPVGCLAAIYAAQRGEQVEVYELRGDLRDPAVTPLNFTKSINLALSERGINSIREANRPGLLDGILERTIPMKGRMIHGEKNGHLVEDAQVYDILGRTIKAVDRGELNKALLDELEAMENVEFFFNHRLTGADFKRNLAWFEKRDPNGSRSPSRTTPSTEIEVAFDFMIGADGAHSSVRYHLMKFARMSYQQEYIDTLWCEFHIPPSNSSQDFRLSPHHLHIWPGGSFMFIAIPSVDKSFTATLFLGNKTFKSLDEDPESLVVPFFRQNFPGVIPDLISEKDAVNQFRTNSHLPLISIKCQPYHYAGSVVILGDAAHAMVPFYGQGMNAGLEDVRVLYEHLDQTKNSPRSTAAVRSQALESYTIARSPDAMAICDLALANYAEMSSHVLSPVYRLRKFVEEFMTRYTPRLGWETQYARVSFGNENYSMVKDEAQRQKRILRAVAVLALGGGLGSVTVLALKLLERVKRR